MLMQQDGAAPAQVLRWPLSVPFLSFRYFSAERMNYSLLTFEVLLLGRSNNAAETQLVLRYRAVETNPAMTNVGGDAGEHAH